MKFLIDNALSPLIARELQKVGYDATHVRQYDMQAAPDTEIFEFAFRERRIIVSADTDFGTLLALRKERFPSVILFRRGTSRIPQQQFAVMLANLPKIQEAIE
jgi:predicted nuclease of predicted toxin-antitoxin system